MSFSESNRRGPFVVWRRLFASTLHLLLFKLLFTDRDVSRAGSLVELSAAPLAKHSVIFWLFVLLLLLPATATCTNVFTASSTIALVYNGVASNSST
jgi:hypothetical protein